MTIRTGPHSGLLYLLQPAAAKSVTSVVQVISILGQPRACAMGLGIAMTETLRARLACLSGRTRAAAGLLAARRAQAEESGTHASGGTPSVLEFHVCPRAVTMLAESFSSISTAAQRPLTTGCWADQDRAARSSSVEVAFGATTVAVSSPLHGLRIRK